MRLILFLDERGGMLFLGKRQSKDSAARAYVLNMAAGHRLWMNVYSMKQFTEGGEISLSESPIHDAGADDFVLIENLPVLLDNASEVILFLWNRHYPSDVRFDIRRLSEAGFHLAASDEFAGTSHEKITVETYRR